RHRALRQHIIGRYRSRANRLFEVLVSLVVAAQQIGSRARAIIGRNRFRRPRDARLISLQRSLELSRRHQLRGRHVRCLPGRHQGNQTKSDIRYPINHCPMAG
ncbi:MAG TPA: hypothetical protein VNH18_36685, partial [Bryobacteraceae bacterium]|nr:hypothetical protein [Bryobacteraceae bacterium]